MKLLATLLAALLLQACALAPSRIAGAEGLFDDRLFGTSSERVGADRVLAASPAMREFVATRIAPQARKVGAQQALVDALYTQSLLRLDYDTEMTRNASEAFDVRAGNCLSLVLMTAALAQEMGLPVRFQSVRVDETWERATDLLFLIGHVNLKVGARPQGQFGSAWSVGNGLDWMVIDFLPGVDLKRQRAQTISTERVVAMYMNNKAAEALARGRLDDAYAWLREASRVDSQYLNTYNTLGVVYHRRGALPEAERALRLTLAHEPANAQALGNLALVLRRQGRAAEAEGLLAELRRLQPVPPFAWFNEGVQAYRAGDYRRARQLFERELGRAPDHHEFHFWLALALTQIGDHDGAREHVQQALENSSTREQSALYGAKLQRLKATRTQ